MKSPEQTHPPKKEKTSLDGYSAFASLWYADPTLHSSTPPDDTASDWNTNPAADEQFSIMLALYRSQVYEKYYTDFTNLNLPPAVD